VDGPLVFTVLKGPRRGLPLSAAGLDEILDGARRRAVCVPRISSTALTSTVARPALCR
jgi:hypothetical protein